MVVAKDRETGKVAVRVIEETDSETLNSFVDEHASPDAEVYTDGATVYKAGRTTRQSLTSIGEYVRGQVHTNGVRIVLEHAQAGLYGRRPPDVAEAPTAVCERVAHVVTGMVGRRLLYRDLTADNGRSPVAS